jgi:hypothetical protein
MGIEYLYENMSKEEYEEMIGQIPLGIVINKTEFELNEDERRLLFILLSSTEMDDSRATLSKLKAELRKEFYT